MLTKCDAENQTHMDCRERWDERQLPRCEYVSQGWAGQQLEENFESPQIHQSNFLKPMAQIVLHHRVGYCHGQCCHSGLCYEHRHGFGEWEGSALRGPEQEAGPTQRNGLFSWFVLVLFLGVVLGVYQSAFKPI